MLYLEISFIIMCTIIWFKNSVSLFEGGDIVSSHLRNSIVLIVTEDLKVVVVSEPINNFSLGIQMLVLSSGGHDLANLSFTICNGIKSVSLDLSNLSHFLSNLFVALVLCLNLDQVCFTLSFCFVSSLGHKGISINKLFCDVGLSFNLFLLGSGLCNCLSDFFLGVCLNHFEISFCKRILF